eukprot:GILJ01010577.1.p1 GENE.GILJ01010577.1~~GILJ01010577.1.p1  ORF type:complete len:377 (-),score=30.78 GILJ01010577.1:968-2098(-)
MSHLLQLLKEAQELKANAILSSEHLQKDGGRNLPRSSSFSQTPPRVSFDSDRSQLKKKPSVSFSPTTTLVKDKPVPKTSQPDKKQTTKSAVSPLNRLVKDTTRPKTSGQSGDVYRVNFSIASLSAAATAHPRDDLPPAGVVSAKVQMWEKQANQARSWHSMPSLSSEPDRGSGTAAVVPVEWKSERSLNVKKTPVKREMIISPPPKAVKPVKRSTGVNDSRKTDIGGSKTTTTTITTTPAGDVAAKSKLHRSQSAPRERLTRTPALTMNNKQPQETSSSILKEKKLQNEIQKMKVEKKMLLKTIKKLQSLNSISSDSTTDSFSNVGTQRKKKKGMFYILLHTVHFITRTDAQIHYIHTYLHACIHTYRFACCSCLQ